MEKEIEIENEVFEIENEISKLNDKLNDKIDYLSRLRCNKIFNNILSNSSSDTIEISIHTNCKSDKDDKNPWTNILLSNSIYNNVKRTLSYPESYKFNSDLKELIFKYLNGDTIEDVSIVCENERLRKEVDSLNTEISKLKNKDMWHEEAIKMFNGLSWWKKMRFKFKI